MPGEHWCNECETVMAKHDDTYTKLTLSDEKETKTRLICPDCLKKKPQVYDTLQALRKIATKTEEWGTSCSMCRKRLHKKKSRLKIEYRENGICYKAQVCHRCLEEHPEILEAFNAIKHPNPTFKVTLTCESMEKCGSYKKPGKDAGSSCGNIVVNIEGELYCRRGHPGTVRLYRERNKLPPSQRKLRKAMTALMPFLESMGNITQGLQEAPAIPEQLNQEHTSTTVAPVNKSYLDRIEALEEAVKYQFGTVDVEAMRTRNKLVEERKVLKDEAKEKYGFGSSEYKAAWNSFSAAFLWNGEGETPQ